MEYIDTQQRTARHSQRSLAECSPPCPKQAAMVWRLPTVGLGAWFFSVLLQPLAVAGQQGPGGLGGFLGVQNLNTTSITVQVRTADGSKLSGIAVVNLSNLMGQLVKSQEAFGSQTVFQVGAGGYTVEVEAFGYETARVKTEVSSASPNQIVVVKLRPETSGGVNFVAASRVPLPPKAQKELAKAYESFQASRFDDALHRLDSAHRLAPRDPDVIYVQGLVYQKKNEFVMARRYWDEALETDPRHISSLLACGEMLLRQNDIEAARKYLDRAADVAPNSWRAHTLLATALLRQHAYADAVTHSERAVELGKGEANSALLIFGQALAGEGQNKEAVDALKQYLATKPPEPQASAVQRLIAELAGRPDVDRGATLGGVTGSLDEAGVAGNLPELPLTAAALHWLPANVDDSVPPVQPGVSCSLPDVIQRAQAHVKELPLLVDRYSATEVLHHEEINSAGYAENVQKLSFNYLVSVREIKNRFGEFLDVQEFRNGSTGNEMFPDKMASTGLPSIALIFHPWLIGDFDMKCEGLSRSSTGFAWQVHFSQKQDKESRIRQYRMGGHVYPIALKGRVWFDANTFQIVRLETDLREPRPDLRLNAEHLTMTYGPVQFKSRKEVLWLPATADYYAVFRGHRFHRQHEFTNYILFSVDDKQKISEPPKEKALADAATDNKVSN